MHKHSALSQFISTRARATRRPAAALTFLARFDFTCTPELWSQSPHTGRDVTVLVTIPTHWAWRYCVGHDPHTLGVTLLCGTLSLQLSPPPPSTHTDRDVTTSLQWCSTETSRPPPPPPPNTHTNTHTLTMTSSRASSDVLRKRHDPPPLPLTVTSSRAFSDLLQQCHDPHTLIVTWPYASSDVLQKRHDPLPPPHSDRDVTLSLQWSSSATSLGCVQAEAKPTVSNRSTVLHSSRAARMYSGRE